jgi:hypothetical protein
MGLPAGLGFRTKGQLAIDILAEAFADGVQLDFVCGDEVYGACTELRDYLEARGHHAGRAPFKRMPGSSKHGSNGKFSTFLAESIVLGVGLPRRPGQGDRAGPRPTHGQS